MNILLLSWRDPKNPRSGGAEYVTLEHAKGWVKRGDMVTWFAAMYSGAKNEEIVKGVHIVRRGNVVSVFMWAMLYYLSKRSSVDLIIDQVHGIPFFAVMYAKVPVVLFLHEIAGKIWDVMYGAPVRWIGKLLERLFLYVYRNHMIWTDANSTVDELVYYGISRSNCIAIPCPIQEYTSLYQKKKNKVFTCISVGRIVRMKRIEDIIVSFAEVARSVPLAKLLIVGSGDLTYTTKLRQLGTSLGLSDAIVWCGKVSELEKRKLLSKSHILLHTSYKEGWGLVVLEAARERVPSVVYPVSGLVDTVKNGETGIITKRENPHDLAVEVIRLYKDTKRYRYMQKNAFEWSNSFRWDEAVDESRAFLQKAYEAQ
ncbi:MAG: glycosyltransferase family 4 protein [Patescibacteria group bacterium]